MARAGTYYNYNPSSPNVVCVGVRALEFYDPVAKKHLQAHMQARYVFILFMQ